MKALTLDEIERLAILAEEAAEVQQIAMKIIRHDYDSCNPFDETKTENRELLEKESGDLKFAIQLMQDNYDVDAYKISRFKAKKKKNISKYLHYNSL